MKLQGTAIDVIHDSSRKLRGLACLFLANEVDLNAVESTGISMLLDGIAEDLEKIVESEEEA